MPGTADGVAHQQPLGERAAVVSTGRAHRKELLTNPRQQDRIIPDAARQHASI
jgi:hypothetical protein